MRHSPNIMLRNSRGAKMHTPELYPLLGVRPGGHLPARGAAAVEIGLDRVRVWIKPANSHGRKHRVWCECPLCHDTLPASRLHQHKCKL